MVTRPVPAAASETREQRIEAILKELRPKIEAVVRRLVERAVDVPEAEEFGAVDFAFRGAGQQLANEVRQAGLASRKKWVPRVQHRLRALRLRRQVPSCQRRRLVTVPGAAWVQRAYYDRGRCPQSFLADAEALGLVDEVSPGRMPPARLAGTLPPFADAAQDLPRRCAGVRLSASAVLRDTEGAGARLRARQPAGRMAEPTQPGPHRTAGRAGSQPAAYLGLDAFRVPLPGSGASRAEHRMRYTALLYTPGKELRKREAVVFRPLLPSTAPWSRCARVGRRSAPADIPAPALRAAPPALAWRRRLAGCSSRPNGTNAKPVPPKPGAAPWCPKNSEENPDPPPSRPTCEQKKSYVRSERQFSPGRGVIAQPLRTIPLTG